MANERGLVISAPVVISGDSMLIKHAWLDPQELRFSLLFWDRLEHPVSQSVQIAQGSDGDFLEQSEILQRSIWSQPHRRDHLHGEQYIEAYIGVFRSLDKKEPGVWSIATGERAVSFGDYDLIAGRGALVQLYRAIPVPDKDVPLQDILEFREKRKAELHALRHHLEAIYQRILAAGDGALAMNSAVEALQIAITNQVKVSKEARFQFRPVSLNASLNLLKGVSIGIAAFATGLPLVPTLIAGAVATISIGPGTSLTWGKPTGTPFRYVSAYHDEVF